VTVTPGRAGPAKEHKAFSAPDGVWGDNRLSQAVGRGCVQDGLPVG
jgi:hypothetical protein